MKKIRTILISLVCTIAFACLTSHALAAASPPTYPNGSDIYVSSSGTTLYGSIQVKPSYNDNGRHYFYGWFKLSHPNKGTYRYETARGTGMNDSRILSKSASLSAPLSPAPLAPIQFSWSYGYDWVLHGSNDWPF